MWQFLDNQITARLNQRTKLSHIEMGFALKLIPEYIMHMKVKIRQVFFCTSSQKVINSKYLKTFEFFNIHISFISVAISIFFIIPFHCIHKCIFRIKQQRTRKNQENTQTEIDLLKNKYHKEIIDYYVSKYKNIYLTKN